MRTHRCVQGVMNVFEATTGPENEGMVVVVVVSTVVVVTVVVEASVVKKQEAAN